MPKSKQARIPSLRVKDTEPMPDLIPIPPDSFIQELADVFYLKLKHPIDINIKASFNRGDADCPTLTLCQMYGELVWKIGKYRYLPFSNAVEFVIDPNWRRSL
jgi:hypothetical protein